jgi:hypothetical protein
MDIVKYSDIIFKIACKWNLHTAQWFVKYNPFKYVINDEIIDDYVEYQVYITFIIKYYKYSYKCIFTLQ